MDITNRHAAFVSFSKHFEGSIFFDDSAEHQAQLFSYATDASVYQEKPVAVSLPATVKDIQRLVSFATEHGLTLIPRAAGTSLAGQVVGSGIVVDISKHFNRVLEVNKAEKWVRVQPGVVRDDLNHFLRPHGLMFGPETSTANRAMIGGMIGNNSCGLHSIVWGTVRDHLQEATVVLSDGSVAVFNDNDAGNSHKMLQGLQDILAVAGNQQLIRNNFPNVQVSRRNTGYALDSLLAMQPFTTNGKPFNACSLLAGSEGTLAFITEAKLKLLELPPEASALVCIHCTSISQALQANIVALRHAPMASELVDKLILDFTITHPEYKKNRVFIEGDPAAILMVEFMAGSNEAVAHQAAMLVQDLQAVGAGYAFPVLYNQQTALAWNVRKAGLGLLRNSKSAAQPVNLIEDCAVAPGDLPAYIKDLQQLLAENNVVASYYAHAGAGELHVEPILDLKTNEGVRLFRKILSETVQLVKKYKGSLSGEHGDGRLRGEFIPAIMGAETYALFGQVKKLFDPKNVFNAGKITGTPSMTSFLRVQQEQVMNPIRTTFNFDDDGGIAKLAEKCSGSGDCRKTEITGGLMCPSYMATRNEKDTTRARANILRQFLSNGQDEHPFGHAEIKEVMDLCLSCKGCKIECPSSVDITKMKAEFLQQYYNQHGAPFRAKLIAGFSRQMALAALLPWAYNFIVGNNLLRKTFNRAVGFHPERTMPHIAKTTLKSWFSNRKSNPKSSKKVHFFCDEFTNYLDAEIGKKAVLLLEALGYEILFPEHAESGRTWLSKGFVKQAAVIANKNIAALAPLVSQQVPLVGIEPSALLTLRDEYISLATTENRKAAQLLGASSFTIEEFIAREALAGNIHKAQFTNQPLAIHLHGHCYQKVLSSVDYSRVILSIPANYTVEIIPSGCCGMAGAFGYEKEHYNVSQQVGELVLFPAIRKLPANAVVAAAGTSCRHQVKDGVNITALHPVEILYNALR